MSTTLSSRWTPFYKFVIPLLVIGGMGTGAVMGFLHPEAQKMPPGLGPYQAWILMAVAVVIAIAVMWWALGRLMRVELDGDELIISNYRTEIRVPLANPAEARVVNAPRIFADSTGAIAGLWKGGVHGVGTQESSPTDQCHDITVYPAIGLAAGACSGNDNCNWDNTNNNNHPVSAGRSLRACLRQ